MFNQRKPQELIKKYKPQLEKLSKHINELISVPALQKELKIDFQLSFNDVCYLYKNTLEKGVIYESTIGKIFEHYHVEIGNFYFDLSRPDIPFFLRNTALNDSIMFYDNLEEYMVLLKDPEYDVEYMMQCYYDMFRSSIEEEQSEDSQIRVKLSNLRKFDNISKKSKEKEIIQDEIKRLGSYTNGVTIYTIRQFLHKTFKHFLLTNIDDFKLDGLYNFDKEEVEFKGNYTLPLNVINDKDPFTDLYQRLFYITLFDDKEQYYQDELKKIENIDINDYANYNFLLKWWDKNLMEGFQIEQRMIYDYPDEVNLNTIEENFYLPSRNFPKIRILKKDLKHIVDFSEKVNEVADILEKLR